MRCSNQTQFPRTPKISSMPASAIKKISSICLARNSIWSQISAAAVSSESSRVRRWPHAFTASRMFPQTAAPRNACLPARPMHSHADDGHGPCSAEVASRSCDDDAR